MPLLDGVPDGAREGASERSSFFEADVPLQRPGSFGYTVRVLPKHRMLSSPAELGLVTFA